MRATIETIEAGSLTVKDRNGDVLKLALTAGTVVTEVTPIAIDAIQSGSFIGTAALPGPDGRLVALEVLVFPEAARGSSEGHFPWDLQPQSTMTNATVTTLAKTAQGRELVLQYKGGEKTVLVPESVPIVTFKPARPQPVGRRLQGHRDSGAEGRHADCPARAGRAQRLCAADVGQPSSGTPPRFPIVP